MVRALLDGQKTQTRRVVNVKPDAELHFGAGRYYFLQDEKKYIHCPFGEVGDRLWVRENFCQYPYELNPQPEDAWYQADGRKPPNFKRWTPSIHMPRWASRITLEITGVRVERLQQISSNDAKAEGVDAPGPGKCWVGQFSYLWDSLNAGRGFGWDANPWVWVVEFKRVQK